jgi:hypothetical protein
MQQESNLLAGEEDVQRILMSEALILIEPDILFFRLPSPSTGGIQCLRACGGVTRVSPATHVRRRARSSSRRNAAPERRGVSGKDHRRRQIDLVAIAAERIRYCHFLPLRWSAMKLALQSGRYSISGSGCRTLCLAAGQVRALARPDAIHWTAASRPGCGEGLGGYEGKIRAPIAFANGVAPGAQLRRHNGCLRSCGNGGRQQDKRRTGEAGSLCSA